jgi:hypothetical protein
MVTKMTSSGPAMVVTQRYSCVRTLTGRFRRGHRGGLIPLSDPCPVPFAQITASAAIARSGGRGRVTCSGLGMTITTGTMTTPRAGTG